MRTTPVGQHSFQLTQSAILFPVNCYLVRENDGFTLIDTSINLFGANKAILAAAQQLGAPIQRIALTHVHGDHIGNLDALHAALPNAEVSFTARELRILDGDRKLDAGESQNPIRGSYIQVKTRPDRIIAPGDRVGSLTVYAAPGHTPGQVAFLDERDQTLIAGDALSTQGGIAVAGVARPIFPFVKMGTWDLATATKSARALRDLHPARLAVGHGKVLEHPDAEMARAIAEAERHGA
jgi:glyoxylase-like metal-dependent hydrolase (beta-lactamase superfamily II)